MKIHGPWWKRINPWWRSKQYHLNALAWRHDAEMYATRHKEELLCLVAAPIFAQIAGRDLDRWQSRGGDGGRIRGDLRYLAIREAAQLIHEVKREAPRFDG